MEVPLLLEDKGEGEMFLEILVLLLCHCFCLLDVLEIGQSFMHEDCKGDIRTPAYSNTLVYTQAEKHGSSIHKVSRHLLSYLDPREQTVERPQSKSRLRGPAVLALAASI